MAFSAEVVNRARNRLGSVLNGKWRLDEILGVGGMATVYAAMHRNQKRGAVKLLHPELSIDEAIRSRFLREGYVANTVDHPGAVTVFDDDVTDDGSAFLVMELLEGETVHARLEREGVLPLAEALAIGDQVLDVLVAAHEKGVIHRDLKPENLFITTNGQVKLLDFGIARLRDLPMGNAGTTATGFFMGTPAFMSPEHARGKWSEVDARSDVWSVGATLFTMMTGLFVHETETAMDTLVMAVTKPAVPIRTVMPEVPAVVAEVIDQALKFHKVDRWDSALTMQAALRSAAETLALAPGNFLVRGMQPVRVVAERSTPSFPGFNATVVSARPPAVGPRVSSSPGHSRSPVFSGATHHPSDPADRSGSGVSVTSLGGARKRRAFASIFVAIASLTVLVFAIASRIRPPKEPPTIIVGAPLVEAPALSSPPLLPSAAPPTTIDTPSVEAAAVASASSVPAIAAGRPSPTFSRLSRPGTPATGSPANPAHSVVASPPPRPSAETPAVGPNPFDRRF